MLIVSLLWRGNWTRTVAEVARAFKMSPAAGKKNMENHLRRHQSYLKKLLMEEWANCCCVPLLPHLGRVRVCHHHHLSSLGSGFISHTIIITACSLKCEHEWIKRHFVSFIYVFIFLCRKFYIKTIENWTVAFCSLDCLLKLCSLLLMWGLIWFDF